jgi:egghead protein (zeste-white 4 protein)
LTPSAGPVDGRDDGVINLGESRMNVGFEEYSLERYNASIRRLVRLKSWYAGLMIGVMAVAAVLFVGVHAPHSTIGRLLQWTTIAWVLPVPLLALLTVLYFGWFRYERFALVRRPVDPRASKPTVIFQTTSTGVNVGTVLNTVRSAVYWTAKHPDLSYRPEFWLVVEEWGYRPNQAALDVLREEGVHIVVTPLNYRTEKGTTRKGRALQYATERRRQLDVPLEQFWVYHQDDETAVGEDTVLGIEEFVNEHRAEKSVGCGIILYPQNAEDFRPSQIQEFGRTKDDIRTLYTITSRYNLFSGFHGSHYLARADLEDETAWDVGPDMNSEDLIFETRTRQQHGAVFHLLKGFAYEQAALTVPDQLKQRRRWFQGWWRAVIHQPFGVGRRLIMSYGMIVWMSAVFSLFAMVSGWIFGFSAIFLYTGALTGYVWAQMVLGYHQGYTLHIGYMGRRRVSLPRVIVNGVIGALADAVAPWYGTFTRRPRTFQVISKDHPAALPRPKPLVLPQYHLGGK